MRRMSEMLSREEIMEKQRSRLDWLKDDDRNTTLFQAKSRERAKKNRMKSLKLENGRPGVKQQEIEAAVVSFYRNLFTAQETLEMEQILEYVPQKVTVVMNESLIRPYSAREVEKALFMMGPNKASGLDGFTAGFYQIHSDLLGPRISNAVLDFLNGGGLPDEINQTTIVLIPKCSNPQQMKQFRPISLCNVIYKICSKVLANRLRPILDEVISEEQSAFVLGRLITDNVLIAYECIHYLNKKKRYDWSMYCEVGYGKSL